MPPLPRRHRTRVSPQPPFFLNGVLFSSLVINPLLFGLLVGVLPRPPSQASFDLLEIDDGIIQIDDANLPLVAHFLPAIDLDLFSEYQIRKILLGSGAEWLIMFGSVYPSQPYLDLGLGRIQNFDRVPVGDPYDPPKMRFRDR